MRRRTYRRYSAPPDFQFRTLRTLQCAARRAGRLRVSSSWPKSRACRNRRLVPAHDRSRAHRPTSRPLRPLVCRTRLDAGRSVLLIAPTGGGKTLAGFLPTLVELSGLHDPPRAAGAKSPSRLISTGHAVRREGGLHTLYISPLKALAVDIARNLERPVAEMGLPIRIETRTGDTPISKRQRQRRDPPEILLTTPEQLALLLASADAPYLFGSLKRVIL